MKKLTTCILLLITLQYTFGLYAVYVFNSMAISQNMRHAIATGSFQPKQVVSIILPLQGSTEAEAKQWQQQEIQYGGKMYDVIQARYKDGKLIVQCLCDDDENNLILSFLNTIRKSGSHPEKTASPLDHLFFPFILHDGCYSFSRPVSSSIAYLQEPVVFAGKSFRPVPAPPPWQV